MWHVMVYSRGFTAYSRPFAVHIFTGGKPGPEEAFRVAERLLDGAFPGWRGGGDYLAYVGYEKVPLEAQGGYVAVQFEIGEGIEGVQAVSTVPPSLAAAVEEYRKAWLTLDLDDKSEYGKAKLIDVVDRLRAEGLPLKVYETRRGFHVRARLPEPRPLREILELRRELGDDSMRLRIDEAYLDHGLGFVTNLLFNEKHWRDYYPGGSLQRTVEVEVDPERITVEFKLPSAAAFKCSIETDRGIIEVGEGEVLFRGRFGLRQMEMIRTSIEDNFWEYGYAYATASSIAELVRAAYRRVSPYLAPLLDKCVITLEEGAVVVHAPDNDTAARLIGRQGANVRLVEREVGLRIKIVVPQTLPEPPEVEMKRRLQELLKALV
ncbi:MAG: KH domain-containing protein [Thermofilaceae archaeon]